MNQGEIFNTRDDFVEAIRAEIATEAEEGKRCPCCGTLIRIYWRRLHRTQARLLCLTAKRFLRVGRWISVNDDLGNGVKINTAGGEFAKLEHWGLIEQAENEDTGKRTSGLWRPTQKGLDFVAQKIKVPSHVALLRNEIVAWSEETISITDALGKSFDYAELMK